MPDGANVFQISRAVRVNTPAFIALAGPSGSGKTRSALELATGLAGPNGKILVGDSEGNRALHYADLYAFDHVEWRPPFTPESNAELIDLAEKRGYAVLVIDSESDEWEGEGGLQEIRENTKDEFWARTKARHKHALVNRMRRAKVHIVFCLRAEERVKISKVDGRTVVEPQGWQPICEKRFMHEVQSSFMFDPKNPGVPAPIKLYDIHARFFPDGQKVSRQAGEALAQWCSGGAPAPTYEPTLIERAEQEADKGYAALETYWHTLSKAEQRQLKPELDSLKQRATDADTEANQADDEDAFGPPPARRAAATDSASGDDRPERRGEPDTEDAVSGSHVGPSDPRPWPERADALAPHVDLAGNSDWRTYADDCIALIGEATPAEASQYRLLDNPHLQLLRRSEASDEFRRIALALTDRAKAAA